VEYGADTRAGEYGADTRAGEYGAGVRAGEYGAGVRAGEYGVRAGSVGRASTPFGGSCGNADEVEVDAGRSLRRRDP